MKRSVLSGMILLVAIGVMAPSAYAKKPANESSELPRGLQKKVARGDQLPPGWQKKLQKGEVLERSVVNQAGTVPERVKVRLPAGEKGSIDITLDGKVIRIDEVSLRVLDIFEVRL